MGLLERTGLKKGNTTEPTIRDKAHRILYDVFVAGELSTTGYKYKTEFADKSRSFDKQNQQNQQNQTKEQKQYEAEVGMVKKVLTVIKTEVGKTNPEDKVPPLLDFAERYHTGEFNVEIPAKKKNKTEEERTEVKEALLNKYFDIVHESLEVEKQLRKLESHRLLKTKIESIPNLKSRLEELEIKRDFAKFSSGTGKPDLLAPFKQFNQACALEKDRNTSEKEALEAKKEMRESARLCKKLISYLKAKEPKEDIFLDVYASDEDKNPLEQEELVLKTAKALGISEGFIKSFEIEDLNDKLISLWISLVESVKPPSQEEVPASLREIKKFDENCNNPEVQKIVGETNVTGQYKQDLGHTRRGELQEAVRRKPGLRK